MLSDGTICSLMSLSAFGGGGYGCINGCVWYKPGSNSSLESIVNGHWIPVEHGFFVGGFVLLEHNVLIWSLESLHSTPRTCTPSPHDTEHYIYVTTNSV